MRIQSRNGGYDDGLDGLDPYFTCPEAIASLIALEGDRLPQRLPETAPLCVRCEQPAVLLLPQTSTTTASKAARYTIT